MRGSSVRWCSCLGSEGFHPVGGRHAASIGIEGAGPKNPSPHPRLGLVSGGGLEEYWVDEVLIFRFGYLEERDCVIVSISSSRCRSRKHKVRGEILGSWLWDPGADTALIGLEAP